MRWSCRLAALVLLLSAPQVPARAAGSVAANFTCQPVAPGVYAVIRNDPPGLMCDGNSLVIVNDRDVVVVDAPEATAEVLVALRKLTPKPVSWVINTHWHDDHITGDALYRAAYPGVRILAHARSREYLPGPGVRARAQMMAGAPEGVKMLRAQLEKGESLMGGALTENERESYASDTALVAHYLDVVPRTEYLLPDSVVTDSLVLQCGRRRIEVRSVGAGHTQGDLIVWLPRERVLATGDLVVAPVPLVGSEQSSMATWSEALDRLCDLHAMAIVPGHGPVQHDDAYMRTMAALFRSIREQVRDAVARGEALEQVRQSVQLDEFRTRIAGPDRVRQMLFGNYVAGPGVAAAYRECKPSDTVQRP